MNKMKVYILICCFLATFVNCLAISYPNVVRLKATIGGQDFCVVNVGGGVLDTVAAMTDREDDYASQLWYAQKVTGNKLVLRSLFLPEDGKFQSAEGVLQPDSVVFGSFSYTDKIKINSINPSIEWALDVVDVKPSYKYRKGSSEKSSKVNYPSGDTWLAPIDGSYLGGITFETNGTMIDKKKGDGGVVEVDGRLYFYCGKTGNDDGKWIKITNNFFSKFSFIDKSLVKSDSTSLVTKLGDTGFLGRRSFFKYCLLKNHEGKFVINRGNGVVTYVDNLESKQDSLCALWKDAKYTNYNVLQSLTDAQYLTSRGTINALKLLWYKPFKVTNAPNYESNEWYNLTFGSFDDGDMKDTQNTLKDTTWQALNVDISPSVTLPKEEGQEKPEYDFGRDTLVHIDGFALYDSVEIVSAKEWNGSKYTTDVKSEFRIVWQDSVPYLRMPTDKLGDRNVQIKFRNTHFDYYMALEEVEHTDTLIFKVNLANAIVRIQTGTGNGKNFKNTGNGVNISGYTYQVDEQASFLWYMKLNEDKTKATFQSLRLDQDGHGYYLYPKNSTTCGLQSEPYEFDIANGALVNILNSNRYIYNVSVAPEIPYTKVYTHRSDGLAFKATECFLVPVEGDYVNGEVDSISITGNPTSELGSVDTHTLRDTFFVRFAPDLDAAAGQTKFNLNVTLRNTRFDRLVSNPEEIRALTTSTTKLVIRRSVFPQSNVGNIDITFENIRNEAGEYLMDFGDHTGYKATLENSADSLAALWRIQDYNDVTDKGHVYGYSFQSMRGTHYITGLFYGNEDDGSILLRDVKPFTIVSRKEFVEEGTYRKYYRLQLYRECDEFTENFKREGLNDAVFYTWPVELAPDVKERLFEFDYQAVRTEKVGDEDVHYLLAPISVYWVEEDSIKIKSGSADLRIVWDNGRPYLRLPISHEKVNNGQDTTVTLTFRNTYFDDYYIFNDQSQVERTVTIKYRVSSMWINVHDDSGHYLDVRYDDGNNKIVTAAADEVVDGRDVQEWRLVRHDFVGNRNVSRYLVQNANGMYMKVNNDMSIEMTFDVAEAAVWERDGEKLRLFENSGYYLSIDGTGASVNNNGTDLKKVNSDYIYTVRLPRGSKELNLDVAEMFADVTIGSPTHRVDEVDIVGIESNTLSYGANLDSFDLKDTRNIVVVPYEMPKVSALEADTGMFMYEARVVTDSFVLVSKFKVHLVPEEYIYTGEDSNWNNMNNWQAVIDGEPADGTTGRYLPFNKSRVTIPDSLSHYPLLEPCLKYYDDSYLPFRELNFSVAPTVDTLYIEHGGEVGRPDLLTYRRVEMDIKHLATMNWTGMTIPLKATYSGDFAFPCLNPLVEMKYPRQTDEAVNWSASYPSGDISVGGKSFAVRVGKVFYDGMTLKETNKPYELGGYGYEYDSKGTKRTDFNNISEYNVKLPAGHAPLYFPRENTCMATYNENTKDIVNECKYQVVRGDTVGRFVFENDENKADFTRLNLVTDKKFAIVANPFCSHLSFDAFYEKNKDVLANKSYMLLKGMNPSYDVPVTEDGKLIAPFQSFVVEIGDGKTGQSIVFTPEMSVTNAVVGGSSVLRSARADKKMTVRTVAGTDTTSITLRVSQYGNDGYQEREDIGKLLVENSNAPEMAFRVEGHNLAVNTSHRMPQSLCLQYLSKRTGQVSILIDGIENMDEGTYYLVDKVTGTREEITDKYKYTFASKGKAEDRFFIERDLREDEYDDVYTYISDTVCGLSDYELSDFKEIGYQTYVKNVELTPIRDSVITLTLLRTPVHADTLTVEANKPGGGYTGYGFDVDMPGTYTHEDVDVYGCDSTFTIKVTSKDFVPVSIYRDGSRIPEKRYAATDGSDLDLKGNDVALFDERQLYTSALLNTPNVIVRNGNSYYSKYMDLKDGFGFYSPVEFTAKEITYERKPDVYADKNKGWEAIVLPFTANLFRNSGSADGMPAGNIVPFSNADGGAYGDFWVKGISQIDVNTIATRRPDLPLMEAYMPYIMAIPGDAWGAEYSFIGQTITFGAEQTIVPQTPDKPFNYGEFDAYLVLADTSVTNAFVLNSTTNIFERMDETTVSPFRFYLKSMGSSVRSLRIYDEDDEITLTPQDAVSTRQGFSLFVNDGDVYILSTSAGTADVYDVNARLMIRNVKYGVGVTKVGTLHTGTYIINGEKIILR